MADIEPPVNVEIEQALLGSIFVHPRVIDQVHFLKPEHFSLGVHGRIFAAILTLTSRGEPANPATLKTMFAKDEALVDQGGAQYLVNLALGAGSALNAAHYGRILVDLYKKREILSLGQEMVEVAQVADLDTPAEAIIRHSEQKLYELGADVTRGHGPVTAAASAQAAVDDMERAHREQGKLLGAPSGLEGLDRIIGGFQPENLYVLGGRPSLGKSVAAATWAESAARRFLDDAAGKHPPKQVAEFSLEMSHPQVTRRRLSSATQIPLERLKRGDIGNDEAEQILAVVREYGRLPILTDDTARLSLPEFRSRLRRMMRQPGGVGIAIIDHLQIMRPSEEAARRGDVAALTEISGGLKAAAKEFGIPILALSQLSRELERRDDKRPMLADLRQSGALEQDADVVMFIYREEYYLLRDPVKLRTGEKDEAYQARKIAWEDALRRHNGRAEIIVAKQRDGATGIVNCYFDGATATIRHGDQSEMPL